MIRRIKIDGLNGSNNVDISFFDDLTIISGRNGCGKTNVLKLIWFLNSPNVERSIREIQFQKVVFENDEYVLSINKKERSAFYEPKNGGEIIEVSSNRDDELFFTPISSKKGNSFFRMNKWEYDLEEINEQIRELNTKSLFFPTYRRIEENGDQFEEDLFIKFAQSIERISNRVGVDNHKFIASVSTQDIKELIASEYASYSDRALMEREKLLKTIVGSISEIKRADKQAMLNKLTSLTDLIDESDTNQAELFTPFEILSKFICEFIDDKAIKVNESLTFGEIDRVVSSDRLSSGEKQILSFLAYNAFYKNTPIIIDEPELSLHIDWQRKIVSALLGQGTSNQLILATHSPFIFAQFPEREVFIGEALK